MFGFSVFLGSDMSQETEDYLIEMSQNGFVGIFTSMHIPEDDQSQYVNRITHLGKLAKEQQLNLMVDISTKGLATLGMDINGDLNKIKKFGITGLRMDYGIPMETIAHVSHQLTVGLNASTLSLEDVAELKKYDAQFSNMEFWHNYYPRVETGLDRDDFIKKNIWLKELGGKIISFTPGDNVLRGPLFCGLPTLEEHRFTHPLAAGIDMLTECLVDEVYIGDGQILPETISQFKHYKEHGVIQLNSQFVAEEYQELLTGVHTNRMDPARDVVRSQEARFKDLPLIKQLNPITRFKGAITLDNQLYERYAGELQIIKNELAADPRVNVMGRVVDKDLDLIKWITAGQKYQFIRKD
ncbi:DUF871 domain-containing protein [Vagococcus hydrophili]|uniref:DUF871 domain-containing protein n=1 Tax=Vagococcus hydrophili TaxID=2714947 RepID=A0A6G8AS24_9ENTE|nr:MupG family TIM beta-alpha barrel fold protein [Vagococcus hydrophili]QIL47769.1 DUF871 domain-containing protein [Vagococcus hydrophili]